jgi:prepilin-type N-terminal cleavage/methylation domain-containing protein
VSARHACRGSPVGCKPLDNAGGTPATTGSGMTIIELLVVIMIILILAGLILNVSSYVQNKGARARAETEIAAMSAALESYKADNGIYPRDPNTTDLLDPRTTFSSSNYQASSLYLYNQLAGATNGSRSPTNRSYMSFKPNQLYPKNQSQPVTYIADPWGNSYGYSTIQNANPGANKGYNPTFDIWSTGIPTPTPTVSPTPTPQDVWIKNW